jgi:hypothetical protein
VPAQAAGAASAFHAGAEAANADHLVFVNPVVAVHKGCLATLMEAAFGDDAVVAVSPKVIGCDGFLAEAGFSYLEGDALKGRGEGARPHLPELNYRCETTGGSRLCLLVHKAAYFACGGMDDRITSPDLALMDLGQSLARGGGKLVYQPAAIVSLQDDLPLRLALSSTGCVGHSAIEALQPVLAEDILGTERGRQIGTQRVFHVGVHRPGRPHTAEHVARSFRDTVKHRVQHQWVAMGDGASSEILRSVTGCTYGRLTEEQAAIHKVLAAEDLTEVDYVILTEDDIILPCGFLDRFLALQHQSGLALAQPAATTSYGSLPPMIQPHEGLMARQTPFVQWKPFVSVHRSAFDYLSTILNSCDEFISIDVISMMSQHNLKSGIIDSTPIDCTIRCINLTSSDTSYRWNNQLKIRYHDMKEILSFHRVLSTMAA